MSDTSGPTRVLLGFAESLAAIEAAWDLLQHGFDVHVFTRSNCRPALASDRRITVHRVAAPEDNTSLTLAELTALADKLSWPVLMPADDASLWLIDAIASASGNALVAGPTGKQAAIALNKQVQLEIAARSGMLVPPTMFRPPLHSAEQNDPVRPSFDPPWIIKPILALELSSSQLRKSRTEVASTFEELTNLLLNRQDGLMIQPYIMGVGEGLFGHARGGMVHNWSAHRRIRMMNPSGSGSSACRSVDPSQEQLPAAQSFITNSQWEGLFMLEFLTDQTGNSWFMELNGRTWGSLVLATRRGLSYPSWAVESALGAETPVDDLPTPPHLTARHIGRELMHLGFVARGRRRRKAALKAGGPIDPAWQNYPTLIGATKEILHREDPTVFYNYRRGKGAVLVRDTLQTFSSMHTSKKKT